jgi:CelD/BcsL family acetyltransferase involved in cellulose biosynthesis
MRYAIAQGDREFDFLRGAEAYKYRWGAENRINKRVRKA